MTNTDRIDKLTELVQQLDGRLAATHREVERLSTLVDGHARALEETKVRLAVAERDIADLKKTHDEWGRRLWALVGPLAGAAVGATLTYLLRR